MSAVAALSSEPVAKIRVMLVQALRSIGGKDAIPHLVAATEDADPAVRNAALHALSSFEGAVVSNVGGRSGGVR